MVAYGSGLICGVGLEGLLEATEFKMVLRRCTYSTPDWLAGLFEQLLLVADSSFVAKLLEFFDPLGRPILKITHFVKFHTKITNTYL